jgi:hypothetical protein
VIEQCGKFTIRGTAAKAVVNAWQAGKHCLSSAFYRLNLPHCSSQLIPSARKTTFSKTIQMEQALSINKKAARLKPRG